MTVPTGGANGGEGTEIQGAEDLPPFGDPVFEAALKRLVVILSGIAVSVAPKLGLGCEALDLAQDLALRLAKRLRRTHAKGNDRLFNDLRQGNNVHGWVARTITNDCRNQIKHEKRLHARHERFTAERPESQITSPTQGNAIETREFGAEVKAALALLTEEQREVFLHSAMDKWTYQEIAQQMKIPLMRVRRRYHAAATLLHERLGHFAGFRPEIELDAEQDEEAL